MGRRKRQRRTLQKKKKNSIAETSTQSKISPFQVDNDQPRIAAVIPLQTKVKRQPPQPRVFCNVCLVEMDVKVNLSSDPNTAHHTAYVPAGLCAQVSLDAMCTLGRGHEKSVDKENFVDKNTPCCLCTDCSEVVEDARELKKHLELLKTDLQSRVILLRSRLQESSSSHQQGLVVGGLKKPRKTIKQLLKVQAVLLKALVEVEEADSLLTNESLQNCKTDYDLSGTTRKRKRAIKVDYDYGDEENHNWSEQQRVHGQRASKSQKVQAVKTEGNPEDQDTQKFSAANTSLVIRQKRQYTRRNPPTKIPKVELEDEEWSPSTSPSKQKRKYTRRKPLKRELLFHQNETLEVDDDGDDFIIPVIQSVKTESGIPLGKGIANLLQVGDGHWLTENIEPCVKGVIVRSTLYAHYYERCLKENRVPPNQATFGKLVKHVFHGVVSTRRLGKRGNSTYCHSGLKFKENSPLNEIFEEYDVVDDNEQPLPDNNKSSKRGRGKVSLLVQLGVNSPPKLTPIIIPKTGNFEPASFKQGLMAGRLQQWPPPPPLFDRTLPLHPQNIQDEDTGPGDNAPFFEYEYESTESEIGALENLLL